MSVFIAFDVAYFLSHFLRSANGVLLPAVVNIPQATQLIRDGQIITVDGAKGRVVLNDGHPLM